MHFTGLTALLAWILASTPPAGFPQGSTEIHALSESSVSDTSDDGTANVPTGNIPASPPARTAVISRTPSFQFEPAAEQAALFTGIMHAKRFISEAGTRDALHGRFFADYIDSITELRGWDDADGFLTSYIGHPMEGAVFHFIQFQNDPRYRSLVFNEGREYWISCLRALAFSAAWSTQWTLGLASEASLGNVQLHSSPGFVDLVGTPTLGTGWAIGEDAVDRYLIARLERHTANRPLLMLVRGFANPTRTFANIMAGRRPWQRDSRPGLFGTAFAERAESVRTGQTANDWNRLAAPLPKTQGLYPEIAPIELEASAHYESFLGGGSCIGGGGQGAFRLSDSLQLVAEISGCLIVNMPTNQSGDSLLYAAGPRWTPRAAHRISPYSQLLFGGRKVTHEILFPEERKRLEDEWDAGQLKHYPMRSDYSIEHGANGATLVAGGGVDINVNPALTVRVANLEFARSFVPVVDGINAQRGVRFSSGLVLRIGTW